MLAQVFLKSGSVVPVHEHPNEQLTYILEGEALGWSSRTTFLMS